MLDRRTGPSVSHPAIPVFLLIAPLPFTSKKSSDFRSGRYNKHYLESVSKRWRHVSFPRSAICDPLPHMGALRSMIRHWLEQGERLLRALWDRLGRMRKWAAWLAKLEHDCQRVIKRNGKAVLFLRQGYFQFLKLPKPPAKQRTVLRRKALEFEGHCDKEKANNLWEKSMKWSFEASVHFIGSKLGAHQLYKRT